MGKGNKLTKPKKSTSVKVNNKNYNRKLKAGKIKPRNKKFSKNQVEPIPQELQETNTEAATDSYEFHPTNKRKYEGNDDLDLQHYERLPRNFNVKRMKYLLPLKDGSGLIPQAFEVQENFVNAVDDSPNFISTDSFQVSSEPVQKLSLIELCAVREKKLEELKEKIGVLCTSIVENPEDNIRLLKEVLAFLDTKDLAVYLSVRKLACLSLVEVFKDILPNYKIRNVSNKEQGQKVKKETRQLREHEDAMLRYYKQFLCKLEKMLECLKSKYKVKVSQGKAKADIQLAALAIKCLSELLVAHPNFNYSINILKIIVEKMVHKNVDIGQLSCDTVVKLFKGDKVGESSVEGVKLIKKVVKSRNFNVPPNVLQTFLSLNVKEALKTDSRKVDKTKEKQKQALLSKREKKRQRKMKDLENELLEAAAEESKSKKTKFQTNVLNEVFLIYFKVLKGDFNLALLGPVLEGLAKFTHLINIDYFDDLISVLYKILESGKLGFTETLNCLKSVFTILSGQGDSINIDPQGFYLHLYRCTLEINLHTSEDDIKLLLQCIDLMIIQRRKKITSQRVFAFLKRLAIVSLFQTHHVTLSLLCLIRQFFMNFKQCDVLLDPENSGNGLYDPTLEDPEYCHASSTVLWELLFLAHSTNPIVAKYAKHLLLRCPTQGQGQLHPFLTLRSPLDILNKFKDDQTALTTFSKGPTGVKRNCTKKLHPCVTDVHSVTSKAVQIVNEK